MKDMVIEGDMRDYVGTITARVRLKHVREMEVRFRVASWIFALGAWVAGTKCEVEFDGD